MVPTNWTIAKRGKLFVVTFENKNLMSVISWSPLFYEKFTRESMRKLGIEEK